MTQKEKELLLKDLFARLPYGVKVWYNGASYVVSTINVEKEEIYIKSDATAIVGWWHSVEHIKPYLRPMSSMTEEERRELKNDTCPNGTGYFDEQYLICPMSHFGEHISYSFMSDILNWLNAHHFDYRGLIEKGLAIEASEGMYKTE